jgi:hypothetical protein
LSAANIIAFSPAWSTISMFVFGLFARGQHEQRHAVAVDHVRVHAIGELLLHLLHIVELDGFDHRVRGGGGRRLRKQRDQRRAGERADQHSTGAGSSDAAAQSAGSGINRMVLHN